VYRLDRHTAADGGDEVRPCADVDWNEPEGAGSRVAQLRSDWCATTGPAFDALSKAERASPQARFAFPPVSPNDLRRTYALRHLAASTRALSLT
jgi:hypothetical protein